MSTTGVQLRPIDLRARAEVQMDARAARMREARERFEAALDWARKAGFDERLEQFAAVDALLLKASGERVSKDGLLERWRTRRPYLFDEIDQGDQR